MVKVARKVSRLRIRARDSDIRISLLSCRLPLHPCGPAAHGRLSTAVPSRSRVGRAMH